MKKEHSVLFIALIFLLACHSENKVSTQSAININELPSELSLFAEDLISTSLYERDIAISPQGDELIYTLGNHKQTRRCLVGVSKQNELWGKPFILNISGLYHDIEPFYDLEGSRLYFASNRPIYNDETRKDYNIWYCNKIDGLWSEPIPLDSTINTAGDEFFPSLSRSGNLYFTAVREDGIGREDIFMSSYINGEFQLPTPLSTKINTTAFEFNAYVAPDESLIVFSSFGRKDGFGGGDLYISQKDADGEWEVAENMGEPINSDKLDFCPFIDWRTGVFYFTSERGVVDDSQIESIEQLKLMSKKVVNGYGNIYKIGFKQLGF